MRVLGFGTYDTRAHPRVGILLDGLRAHGHDVGEVNAPLGLDTAARVALLQQPWRLPLLAARLLRCWTRLALRAHRGAAPDLVVVGYLGHFDVLLARALFPRTRIALDLLVFGADTAGDRGVRSGGRQRLLRALDRTAIRAADVVIVDTDEHAAMVPGPHRGKAVVVPVGAPASWFPAGPPAAAAPGAGDGEDRDLEVVFYGLFTPLQGAPVIAEAATLLAGAPIRLTLIGSGQDHPAARALAGDLPFVRWRDWVPAAELPASVAAADVCLGIFGTGPKARRVVPNKIYQGAAAGCALLTSETPPQRRTLGDAASYVPAGDPQALAARLRELAGDRAQLRELRARSRILADSRFRAAQVVRPLLDRLRTAEED